VQNRLDYEQRGQAGDHLLWLEANTCIIACRRWTGPSGFGPALGTLAAGRHMLLEKSLGYIRLSAQGQ